MTAVLDQAFGFIEQGINHFAFERAGFAGDPVENLSQPRRMGVGFRQVLAESLMKRRVCRRIDQELGFDGNHLLG